MNKIGVSHSHQMRNAEKPIQKKAFPQRCVSGSETLVGSESGTEINVSDPDSDSNPDPYPAQNKVVETTTYDIFHIFLE